MTWSCPCGHTNSSEYDYCYECTACRDRPGLYRNSGNIARFWKVMDAKLRMMYRRDSDAEISCCMEAYPDEPKELLEKVAALGGHAHHIIAEIYTLRCKMSQLREIASLEDIHYIEGPSTFHAC